MKRITIILACIFIATFFIRLENKKPEWYRNKVESVYKTIPIFSDDGKCLKESYSPETYFFGASNFDANTPYNDPSKTCIFKPRDSMVKILNEYRDYLTKNGWLLEDSIFNNLEEQSAKGEACFGHTFFKQGYSVGTSSCFTEGHGVNLTVQFNYANSELQKEFRNLTRPHIILTITKGVLSILVIIFAIMTFIRRKK